MPRQKYDLNTVFITERLSVKLRDISRCALTTVVAPMGYGKTTAVNWFLDEQSGAVIRISVYSDNLAVFWRSVQDAFARAGFDFLRDYSCPTDSADSAILADELCTIPDDCFIFIDDFHLLTDSRASAFICMLANRLPTNIHLIIASRDRFLPPAETIRLGARLCLIGVEQLRLSQTELRLYAHRAGIELPDDTLESLLYSSEGWFSAIYLNLRAYSDNGRLPDSDSDIYSTFKAALIDPLGEAQREFLAVMGLADEFTTEMARFVTGDDSEELLSVLTAQNAFVKRLPDGSYRFHHMLKECAKKAFLTLDRDRQKLYLNRYGSWYEEHRLFLHAMSAYLQSGDFDSLLHIVELDAGILLSSIPPEKVLSALETCPTGILKSHPTALLVLMRSMFNWHNIPKMLELRTLLLSAAKDPDILGECDLIMSFLCYNDISAMSKLHRSASAQMSRPAISIRNSGGWTFGSPSVLMMFYRAPGELESELCEMDECMPHYYRITNHHGQGAEKLMRAEAAFMQGNFTDAHIGLEKAYADIEGNGQENMALCCDFLAQRLSLHTDIKPRLSTEERYESLLRHHNSAWINILNAGSAYFNALRGDIKRIPIVFTEHRLGTISILAPGKPMITMIENQVYLAEGDYAKVIGRAGSQLAVCEAMHYALVKLHIDIQTASAYAMLGKHDEAGRILVQAIETAKPDHFVMPFVENYGYIKNLLPDNDFTKEITRLGKAAEKHRGIRPERFSELTEREYEIVRLINERLSNREIAERLFLSEGSVKQYVNQIYSKLGIEGEHTKRKQLLELMNEKVNH